MCMRGQVRFVVMGSVFPTEVRLHRKYDLKGSTQGRTVGAKKLSNPDTCLKVCAPHFHPILVPADALPSVHTAHRRFCLLSFTSVSFCNAARGVNPVCECYQGRVLHIHQSG
jgi:hypothetical protein